MLWYLAPAICFLMHLAPVAAADGSGASVKSPVEVRSSNRDVRAEVWAEKPSGGHASAATYRVFFHDREVVLPSRLGVDLTDGSRLGADSIVKDVETRSFRETYTQFPGKRRAVLDEGTETIVTFREQGETGRRWQLVVRAYDDGAAFRYRFPAQQGWEQLEIATERTTFQFPGDPVAYAMPLPSFTTPHEEHYQKRPVSRLPADGLIGMPALFDLPGTGVAAVLEANVTDYAAMYLTRTAEGDASLAVRLAPLPNETNVAVRAKLPHDSPWRVLMIADKAERLVESDLVLNLNEPNAIGDTSWIKPGKTTFPWWNGFYEKDVPFKMGLNTETAKYYIDFCAEAGIDYHSLDGLDNIAWYGGTIVPYTGGDITKGIDGLDFPEVIRYAKEKGVKLRLWMHWQAAEKHMDRAFPLYKQWGIEGVMVDFIDRDDQAISHFIRRLLKKAADNRLTVTIHNTKEPTGLERTFPNLLATEAVRNLEFDKWDPAGIPPEHDLIVPFTRMLSGPMDYHQGTFRGVPVNEFKPRNAAPLVMGTACHMLATYVVYQNHLPMVADYPSAYRGHPLLPVLAKIPDTWDDTRCVASSVGEYVIVARRSGDGWWIGAMTDRKPRDLKVLLDFLDPGNYRASVYRDDLEASHGVAEDRKEVGAGDQLPVSLASAGGVLIHLKPRD